MNAGSWVVVVEELVLSFIFFNSEDLGLTGNCSPIAYLIKHETSIFTSVSISNFLLCATSFSACSLQFLVSPGLYDSNTPPSRVPAGHGILDHHLIQRLLKLP